MCPSMRASARLTVKEEPLVFTYSILTLLVHFRISTHVITLDHIDDVLVLSSSDHGEVRSILRVDHFLTSIYHHFSPRERSSSRTEPGRHWRATPPDDHTCSLQWITVHKVTLEYRTRCLLRLVAGSVGENSDSLQSQLPAITRSNPGKVLCFR